jgi:uncharacterized cupin superfamily protein
MPEKRPVAIVASEIPVRALKSNYPGPFAARVAGRHKQQLGEFFGLSVFGVNRTRLEPGAQSALRHWHENQDEFTYVLEGEAVLITDEGETRLTPGMCAGFKAGVANGHHLVNRSNQDVVYLEIGDRTPGGGGAYPDDDIAVAMVDGRMKFTHKDGTPY